MDANYDSKLSFGRNGDIQKILSGGIDLRTLVYIYMAQNPGATQTSVAEKMGVAQASLSRALMTERFGVKEDMIPGVIKLINELNVEDFSEKWKEIKYLAGTYDRQAKRTAAISILLSYINASDQTQYEFRTFAPLPNCIVYANAEKRQKWYFLESFQGVATLLDQNRKLDRLIKSPTDRVSFICYDFIKFLQLTSNETIYCLGRDSIIRYRSVVCVNAIEGRVEEEYMLTFPEDSI